MFNFNGQLQELRSTIIGLVLLLAATIIGFVWISIGVYQWLTLCLGAVWGPIVLGLIYFLPIVIFAFMKAFRPPLPQASAPGEHVDMTVLNISKVFDSLSGRSPFLVASAVIIAGFLATRFPALLSVFTQILAAYAEDLKTRAKQPNTTQDQTTQASNTEIN